MQLKWNMGLVRQSWFFFTAYQNRRASACLLVYETCKVPTAPDQSIGTGGPHPPFASLGHSRERRDETPLHRKR